MRLITSLTLGLITTTSLLAQTTMCFKENHTSMSTIESTTLDGGLCSSTKSAQVMKNEGWSVDDIKIEKSSNGNNYIYIFKKETTITAMDEEKLEQRIMQKLEVRKKEEAEAKKIKTLEKMSKNGKELYVNTCQSCHGEKAEKRAYATSRPLIDLNLADFEQSIREYSIDEYDRGKAFVMKPYATMLTNNIIKEVYSYIRTLKPKKEEESK